MLHFCAAFTLSHLNCVSEVTEPIFAERFDTDQRSSSCSHVEVVCMCVLSVVNQFVVVYPAHVVLSCTKARASAVPPSLSFRVQIKKTQVAPNSQPTSGCITSLGRRVERSNELGDALGANIVLPASLLIGDEISENLESLCETHICFQRRTNNQCVGSKVLINLTVETVTTNERCINKQLRFLHQRRNQLKQVCLHNNSAGQRAKCCYKDQRTQVHERVGRDAH